MIKQKSTARPRYLRGGKWIAGTFFCVPLGDGTFGYGRVRDSYGNLSFYKYRTQALSFDLHEIEAKPVLFTVMVRIFRDTRWRIIGCGELNGHVAQPVVKFMQDLADFRKCVIYDTAGMKRDATPEECVGLERAAAWDPNHVEDRLRDNLASRESRWENETRVRLTAD